MNRYLKEIADICKIHKHLTMHTAPKDTKSEKQAQLPHEKKSKLTPGEIEAIKAMRANPHIPEDAKPPLPEVH